MPRPLLAAIILGLLAGCVMRDDEQAPRPPMTMAPPPAPPAAPLVAQAPGVSAETLPPPAAPDQPSNAEAQKLGLAGKTTLALLLPLSGPYAPLGMDMQDAALMAAQQLGGSQLALICKDTGGTASGAAEAARQAVAAGARLILGPLTAAETEATKPVAAGAGINVVAFSNNVAHIGGDGVFVLGFLPQQEIQRVISYAHGTGLDHFALIAPADSYGQLTADAYQKVAGTLGVVAEPPELYQPDKSDIQEVVRHLANKGQFAFTALLLPARGADLKQVASTLSGVEIGAPKVRLLGTSLWDADRPGNEPTLVGGWYAAPSKLNHDRFDQSFAAAYGHSPQRLASLAYDAVALGAVLSRSNSSDFSAAALTNPNGFAGVDGLFRLKPDGSNERGLDILQVEPNHVTVISPAPESFQSVGQ